MRFPVLPSAILASVLVAAAPGRAWQDPARPSGDGEIRALFDWYDDLGLPSGDGLPFVEITAGVSEWDEDGEPVPDRRHGFLLEDRGTVFRILVLNLWE